MGNSALLIALIFCAAVLYSSVGHAGASGYLAAMALFGVAPDAMKPSALILNILVATIATVRYARAGLFSWKILLPFVIGSIPLSFVGGAITLPGHAYRVFVGIVLLFAAFRLFLSTRVSQQQEVRDVVPPIAVVCGAGIGFLSGLTGTGGGIFLSPLLLFTRWSETRTASGVCAAFILVNSIAGLAGHAPKIDKLPASLPYWAVAAVAGGLLGSYFGAKRFDVVTLRRLLSAVLVVAALKLMFT